MKIFKSVIGFGLGMMASGAMALGNPYTLGGATVGGESWTDATVITAGQAYSVAIALDYSRPGAAWGPGSHFYEAAHDVGLYVGLSEVGNVEAAAPFSSEMGNTCWPFNCQNITSAQWTLSGSITIQNEGVMNVGSLALPNLTQQITVRAAELEAAAVPAPGTLAIFALGLFGLAGARRLKQRR